jgi:hypothetical protein
LCLHLIKEAHGRSKRGQKKVCCMLTPLSLKVETRLIDETY